MGAPAASLLLLLLLFACCWAPGGANLSQDGYWQEQDLELGTLAPLDEAISSTVWSSPDMLASQGPLLCWEHPLAISWKWNSSNQERNKQTGRGKVVAGRPNVEQQICLCVFRDSQPWTSDETVVAGGTVVLKCQVKDHEDSSLQWSNPAQQTLYFGEKRALRDNRIQLVTSTPHELSISISNVALADEGEYTCSIFTMPVRTAKSLVTVLGIPQKPIITGYKSSLREKDTATLNCQSSGSKPAARLTWRKGDQELHGEPTRIQEDPNGKTFTVSSSVTFQVTREDDGASIVCSVNHESLKGADRSTSQRIEVLYTPTAMIRPDPPHPREGQKLLLHCEGRGNPVPQQYLWEKEGSVPPLKMTQESALIFPFLNKSDSGTYGCTATSNMGSYKAYYTLNVNDPSPVPSSSSTYHAIIGGIVAFIVFLLLIMLIFLGHYLIRHKGTYLTHEAKGSDDAPDADTAIINAEGGQSGGDDKKEYFI
ncbi:cell adhesion molecule 3 isoform X1 [Homo sapiens]|uniref:cell adhesion molecule 3 isoform X1 n=1 Tax=Homo sapiens TaxID=9606 RepID=UPI000D0C8BDE|nr:cell adhesion molecule 3 isoform X1 [Homo sapiens]XP_054193919.1 cell adhesion molecule 3 isoform X1 [Homo sapiens]|eukprot:XP_024304528.1 cell adhesion molecule 3 isoform X1 [Homo sapiens]